MKFPLIKGKKSYWAPFCAGKKCKICGQKDNSSNKFIALMGGALKGNSKNAEMSSDLIGFLDLTLHNHDYKGRGGYIQIVDSSANGQFDLYFCSTKCLRKFFNLLVDEFEKGINNETKSAT